MLKTGGLLREFKGCNCRPMGKTKFLKVANPMLNTASNFFFIT